MDKVHCQEWVSRPFTAFKDRWDAGEKLVDLLDLKTRTNSMVLALPRGGVPVAAAIARNLDTDLKAVPVRKLPIPSSPEAGFGAVTLDGGTTFNYELLMQVSISELEIDHAVRKTLEEVKRRAEEYGWVDDPSIFKDRRIYMVDDGLASGYSMLAAIKMIDRMAPAELILCVPCAPSRSISALKEYFNEIYCLVIQTRGSFAVASYYEDFKDLSDEEVIITLKNLRTPGQDIGRVKRRP